VILALPLAAVLLLTGLIAFGALAQARQAEQARLLVALGGAAGELTGRLQQERATAALVFAADRSASGAVQDYRQRAAATDAAAGVFMAARQGVRLPAGLDAVVRRVDVQLSGLAVLRQQVASSPDASASLAVFRYRAVVADLLAYRQGLSQVGVDAATANDLRAAAALSQAIESLGLLQVAVTRAVDAGQLTPAAQQEVVAADAGFTEAMQAFRSLAPAGWQAQLSALVGGEAVVRAERLQGVVVRAGPDAPLRVDVSALQWSIAAATRMELLHTVERRFDAELLAEVTRQRDAQRRWITGLGAAVLAGLVVMVAIGWWVTRSLAGSLTRLRAGAEIVATDRLPRMVAQLDTGRSDPATVQRLMAEAAEPVPVDGRDEVGQVAAAFNSVAASAVRVAGEQAALRASVAQIFESLSRRLQQRADRTMSSVDTLERDEQDPDRLAKLFALDHEVTLLRRLIVGLQVLAGGRAGRPEAEPVPLPDLLRAAYSQIDDYRRVELGDVDAEVAIIPDAAPALIHLLAELMDNAARFSAPDVVVQVHGRRVGDLLHLQIRDTGLGIRAEDLDAIRQLLADPHRVDHRTAQQMGLPVVGRIAGRLGIGVEFRSQWQGGGTRVDITVPADLFDVAPPPAAPAPGPAPAAIPAPRPAAELAAAPRTDAAVVAGTTMQLATIGRPAHAAAPHRPVAGPPPWPPPSPHLPGVGAQRVEPPPLVIFEQVSRSSWFTDLDTGEQPAAAPAPQWQAATAAAEAARTAPVPTTANGLPVRQAGRRLIPEVATTARVPTQRDPDAVRRRVSAFQSGLAHAGRRSQPPSAKESTR
jgi:signal transduction histidine kinase